MFRMISRLLWVFATLLAAQARNNDFLDDEMYKKIMDEMDIEEEQARNLIGIEADGSLGSKCGLFDECNKGFECVRGRCIPNRDCLREQIENFNASFDADGYKQLMYKATGVKEEDLMLAFQQSDGDQAAFVQSPAMKSWVGYMQNNGGPFEPLTEIVDSCSGIVSGRRLNIDETTMRSGDMETDKEERRLQTTPSPSVSAAPSAAPTVSRAQTNWLGVHIEGGFIYEVSMTLAWRVGSNSDDVFTRGCFGAVAGGGFQTSFYLAIAFDGVDTGWDCGSVLFDTDAGLGLNLGFGLGLCFLRTNTVYIEFTIGAGIGAGFGFNICGVSSSSESTDSTSESTDGTLGP